MAQNIQFAIVRGPADLAQIPEFAFVVGIEVPPTAPAEVQGRCQVIVDPQHTEGSAECAAMRIWRSASWAEDCVLTHGRPVWLITPRFDLDAAAAMAIFALAAEGVDLSSGETQSRLEAIQRADSFLTAGEWPGRLPLPTTDKPWDTVGGVADIETLAAPNWITSWAAGPNPRLSVAEAVEVVSYWLTATDEPKNLRALPGAQTRAVLLLAEAYQEALNARMAVLDALEAGQLAPEVAEDGKSVFMDVVGCNLPTNSTAGIAYRLAPVSIVRLMDLRAGFIRYSIAAYKPHYLDFQGAVDALNAAEQSGGKWGGNPASGIIGAPLDVQTSLADAAGRVRALVAPHIRFGED